MVNRQNRFVYCLYITDNQQTFLLILKSFASLELSLVIAIDDHKQLIAKCLGVVKILQMPFVQRVKIARYNDCFFLHYSTVTDCVKKEVNPISTSFVDKYNSIMLDFIVSIRTSKLTKTSHYNDYQQSLFEEIKRLKEIEGYGYRRISYILYEKGYRSIRTDSILKNNYIYSIYKKGKVRENRINRDYKPKVDEINVYQCF